MVSVIISTHKREPTIVSRAVESVLRQTYRDIEIIVVDDSPSDYPLRTDVEDAVRRHGAENHGIPVAYYAHETNRGACAARNTGIRHAKGEYIACLDDDDEWMPEKLAKQMRVMQSSEAALVYCGCICKNDVTGVAGERKTEYHRGYLFEKLLARNFIDSTSIPLIRKECVIAAGGFDEEMQSAQDCDLWLRIAEKYPIDYVEEPLVIYHEHGGEQITSNPVKRINGLERLNEKYKSYLDADKNLWHRRHIFITPYYAMAGDGKKALRVWFQCVLKCPGKVIENLKYLRLIIIAIRKASHE